MKYPFLAIAVCLLLPISAHVEAAAFTEISWCDQIVSSAMKGYDSSYEKIVKIKGQQERMLQMNGLLAKQSKLSKPQAYTLFMDQCRKANEDENVDSPLKLQAAN